MTISLTFALSLALIMVGAVVGAQTPAAQPDVHRRLLRLGDFRLESGVVLPNASLAYATWGTLNAAGDNATLIPSWYGSDHHGYESQFIKDVAFTPIPSVWGHLAGGGANAADNDFINAQVRRFLEPR